MKTIERRRILGSVAAVWAAVMFCGAAFRVLADCASFGLPFTDVGSEPGFCAAIAEAYYAGLTHGTSPTTFSPDANVTRVQAAAFATRTLDAALTRGSRRAALGQWWMTTPRYDLGLGLTTVGTHPRSVRSDGADLWVGNSGDDTVSRVRASDGRLLETWTAALKPAGILIAMGKVFVVGSTSPGSLYMIDPAQSAGAVTVISNALADNPESIAFDGTKIWIAGGASISIITPGTWDVAIISDGFVSPRGILFDGENVWVADWTGPPADLGTLKKLDGAGQVLQAVSVGTVPGSGVFDGHNIWVPNVFSSSLTVVRANDGTILTTFSSQDGNQNGLSIPFEAAFDGQRVAVANFGSGISLFDASRLSAVGSFLTPGVGNAVGICSDGINFWVSFDGSASIGRF